MKILISNPQVPNMKPDQKFLTTDMRDSKSLTEILFFNHHLSGPMKSYNDFFFSQRPIYDKKNLIDKIYHKIYCLRSAVYQKKKTDNNCPIAIFVPFFFSSLTSIPHHT